MALYAEGFVKYPEELPCPQVDTDIKPRERRYISDIGEVKKLRRFQSTFQAERKKISFIFTRAQAEEFRKWYKEDIIEGGAWFYADWPILHKEKNIAYRFITRPVWEFLARGVYHVSASVELYERKVGKPLNVCTSKIYPYYFDDKMAYDGMTTKSMPNVKWGDLVSYEGIKVSSGSYTEWIYSSYRMTSEAVTYEGIKVSSGSYTEWIYSSYRMTSEAVTYEGIKVDNCNIIARLVTYDYFAKGENSMAYEGISIISGAIS